MNIPSLRGVRYLGPYGHDGRTASLRDFIRDTVERTFGGDKIGDFDLDALTQYTLQQDFLPNPKINARGVLRDTASPLEKSGERLFHAKGCVSCHIPERYFTDGKIWRMNGEETMSPYSMENGVKTPTLMRPARKQYLHDGRVAGDSLLNAHATQLATRIDAAESEPLSAYLAALRYEEKPEDQRHITERVMEIHTWLKLIGREGVLSVDRQFILLKTLELEFVQLLRHSPQNNRFYADYMRGLSALRKDLTPGMVQKFHDENLAKIRFLAEK